MEIALKWVYQTTLDLRLFFFPVDISFTPR